MISDHHDARRSPRPARWRDARRALRGLPMIADEPERVRAILDATVDLSSSDDRDYPTNRTRAGLDRFWTFAAAAASIAIVAVGAWIWNAPAVDGGLTEAELARLDAEVELALVHLGRVLHASDRLAIVDALGTDPASQTIAD